MKLRSLQDLQAALDEESAWRKKELIDTRLHVRGTAEPAQRSLRRAGFALTYSHWEGFTKSAFEFYLSYIRSKQLNLDQLHHSLAALAISKQMRQMGGIEESRLPLAILRLRTPGTSGVLPASEAVTAKSNLNSQSLVALLTTFGLEASEYETRYKWLDSVLLAGRNNIAHGRETAPSLVDYNEAVDEVLFLIDTVNAQVLNAAAQKQFLAA